MTRLTLFLLTTTFLLLGQSSNGQTNSHAKDTLFFQKIKNTNKKLGLPLNDFGVILKPTNGRRQRVIITDYTDSTLILKVYSFKKDERKAKRAAGFEVWKDTSLTNTERDSLNNLIMYSIHDTINLSQVDKIIISNSNRPDKRWLVHTSYWAAGGWFVSMFPIMTLVPIFPAFVIVGTLNVAVVVFGIIVENKTINMDKWQVTPRQL